MPWQNVLRQAHEAIDAAITTRHLSCMSVAKAFLDIPEKPVERRAWIHFRLKATGTSFRSLAKKLGCSPQALHCAASGLPSSHLERALADAIGVQAELLFKEHYAPDGSRIPTTRAPLRADKSAVIHSRPAASRNVKNGVEA